MVRTIHCLTLAVAVVAVTSTSVTQASIKNVDSSSSGVCGEQASNCRLTFVNNECVGDKRVVSGRWVPTADCETSYHLGFPDVCAVDNNNVAVKTTFSWKAGWFKRFCQEVDPGVKAQFAIRDHTDCTGSALVNFHYTGGRLATVARCAPAETEASDLGTYEHAWYEKYAELWSESMSWPTAVDGEGKVSYFKEDDPDYRPPVPKACLWEVSFLACPPKPEDPTIVCCQAETASCKACATGWSVEDYCVGYPDTVGCPKLCCFSEEATCNACRAGEDVEDYCTLNTHVDGCCDLFPDMFGCEH